MLAGHTMLVIFAQLRDRACGCGGVLSWCSACCRSWSIVALIFLELLVAFLQAYVFAILTCLYLNDAIHLH